VYVRTVGGKETTFGVSGALWRDALVMYDRDSGSYWSQVNATGISGEHTGDVLTELPSVVTTWGEWKTLHPGTLVLEKPALEGSPYDRYFASADALGASGRGSSDDRLPGKDLVVGVRAGDGTAAVPLEKLRAAGVLTGMVGDTPVVWLSLGDPGAAAYDRRLGDQVIALERQADGGYTADGSAFDPTTGAFTAGPLAGQSLRRLPAMRVYWYSWTAFHPKTGLVGTTE
jgi:hypothetical protein